MVNLKFYQFICGIFPPILSQSIRSKVFPLDKARKLGVEFSKTSITGSKFYGNTADDHSYRFAIHGFFDWRNIIIANRYCKQFTGDIIEIGANVGTETISFCDLIVSAGKVHAFEPVPENVKALETLLKQVENLIIYPKAISNKKGTVFFQNPPIHESGIGTIIEVEDKQEKDTLDFIEVQALPLDSLFENFRNVCLISIDTEGHEPFVLASAQKVIGTFRPAVIIEVSPKLLRENANSTSLDILSYFAEINYSCYTIERFALKKVKESNLGSRKSQNWFCVPSEKSEVLKSIKRDLMIRALIPWYFLKPLN